MVDTARRGLAERDNYRNTLEACTILSELPVNENLSFYTVRRKTGEVHHNVPGPASIAKDAGATLGYSDAGGGQRYTPIVLGPTVKVAEPESEIIVDKVAGRGVETNKLYYVFKDSGPLTQQEISAFPALLNGFFDVPSHPPTNLPNVNMNLIAMRAGHQGGWAHPAQDSFFAFDVGASEFDGVDRISRFSANYILQSPSFIELREIIVYKRSVFIRTITPEGVVTDSSTPDYVGYMTVTKAVPQFQEAIPGAGRVGYAIIFTGSFPYIHRWPRFPSYANFSDREGVLSIDAPNWHWRINDSSTLERTISLLTDAPLGFGTPFASIPKNSLIVGGHEWLGLGGSNAGLPSPYEFPFRDFDFLSPPDTTTLISARAAIPALPVILNP